MQYYAIKGIVSGTNAYTHVKTLLTLVDLSFYSNLYPDIVVITHTFLKSLSFPAFCHGEAFSFVHGKEIAPPAPKYEALTRC